MSISNNHPFTKNLIHWQKQHGRHNLPWQVRDPYHVWLSEIMLQQTQVKTVLDYYPRFLEKFPTVQHLANASEDEVLTLWSGLGYYSRARNLHLAAKQIISEFNGTFPEKEGELQTLKGVGRSTAAAISAFSFHQRAAILDGNVKRVLCRVFLKDGEPSDKKFENNLWDLAISLLPSSKDISTYTQGLMDLGATICTRSKPKCTECPIQQNCLALANNQATELPRRKKAKIAPIKELFWLILTNTKNEILLHKRPNTGIWGGLYCVPCFESLSDATQFCEDNKLDLNHFDQQTIIKHRLTHFQLLITPLTLNKQPETLKPKNFNWQTRLDALNQGLPKPLQRWLVDWLN